MFDSTNVSSKKLRCVSFFHLLKVLSRF